MVEKTTRYELREHDANRDAPGWHVLAVFDTPEDAECDRKDALLVARGLLRVVEVVE